jgi:4-coumarate--CoA ligase
MGWHPDEHSDSFSVGELNANVEAMLVDDDGNEVKQGERGEILIRAPNVMKGYWGRPEATAETMTPDGWLKTGDIAYHDQNGKFFIVDRKKVRLFAHSKKRIALTTTQELIKVKGNQVAPAELEALLLDHEAIADVAVIGVTMLVRPLPKRHRLLTPGTSQGEEQPRAYVVLGEGKKATEQEIQKWMEQHVTRHKWLTGGVRFVESIPKNPVSACVPFPFHVAVCI